jgi:hypothetical protein
MSASHAPPPKPSPLVCLICLAIVHRLRPDWVSVPLQAAAREAEISAQRLSRLCSRAIAAFEGVVATLSRRGRPPGSTATKDHDEHVITSALLEVATSLLGALRLRGETVRALCVGAYLRLRQAHPKLTQKRFCATLGLPERTLRAWLRAAPAAPQHAVVAPPPEPEQKRPPRRPRFGFDVTVPDTQLAADTTQLEAFGVKVALVAAQDVGGRDQDLLDAIVVDDHEDAEHVVTVLEEAIGEQTGQQVLTDQGTPYLAKRTEEALDQLDTEHAPQREGDPQGKATVERAFGTVKQLMGPLLALTNELAARIAALRRVDLARAVTKLLLTMLLRAYQAGARASERASDARAGVDAQTLERVAAESRERARAEHRSRRLLLTWLHTAYQLDTPLRRFIAAFRRFPLAVLHRAETAFARQAHRGDIAKRTAYFAAIVRRFHREHQAAKALQAELTHQRDLRRQNAALDKRLTDAPEQQLASALEMLAAQLTPDRRSLIAEGAGLGRAWLRRAVERLRQRDGLTADDIARGVFCAFENRRVDLDADAIAPLRRLLDDHLTPAPKDHCAGPSICDILSRAGPNRRPEPSPTLRT